MSIRYLGEYAFTPNTWGVRLKFKHNVPFDRSSCTHTVRLVVTLLYMLNFITFVIFVNLL